MLPDTSPDSMGETLDDQATTTLFEDTQPE